MSDTYYRPNGILMYVAVLEKSKGRRPHVLIKKQSEDAHKHITQSLLDIIACNKGI